MHAAILTDQNRINRDNTHQKTLHTVRPLLTFETARETIHIASPGRSLVPTEINVQTACTHRNIQGKKIHMLIDEIFHFNPTMESDFSCFDISDTLIDKISF